MKKRDKKQISQTKKETKSFKKEIKEAIKFFSKNKTKIQQAESLERN